MQLAIPLNKFDANRIYFAEKKRNVVIEGDFIKIIYSDNHVDLNELYIFCDFVVPIREEESGDGFVMMKRTSASKTCSNLIAGEGSFRNKKFGKNAFEFDMSCEENMETIAKLCGIETDILNRYIKTTSPVKTAVYSLRAQLANGVIRGGNVESDSTSANSRVTLAEHLHDTNKKACILKIAGLWETDLNVGITLKFLCAKPLD